MNSIKGYFHPIITNGCRQKPPLRGPLLRNMTYRQTKSADTAQHRGSTVRQT
ncbi:hypothetical protein [Erwinia endophytica]|uniref:hypothetical protein n=1 Tax=Erwinia endophytica TaxID=1563158 RepID=UPI00186B7E13|nr:hypothetical protein [Erwinia endophytica]